MVVIEVTGHVMFRFWTQSTLDKYMGVNQNARLFKNKGLEEDSLVSKDYFKSV